MSRLVVRGLALFVALLVTTLGLPIIAANAAPEPPRVSPTANPDLTSGCGLDLVLVLDESRSVDDAASDVRAAARTFLDAFEDTSTRAAIVTFSTKATIDVPMTYVTAASNSTGGVHENAIASYDPDNRTNWQDALLKAKNAFANASPARSVPKLVVFVTDGAPNTVNNGATNTTNVTEASAAAVDPAVTEMNAMKASGVHSLVVGAGNAFDNTSASDPNIDALYRVSQYPTPKIYPNTAFDAATTDLILQKNFSALQTDLRNVANQICDGTLTITKYTSNANNPDSYSKAGAGWDFTASVNPSGGWILPSTGSGASKSTVTDANSIAQFQWNPGTSNWSKTATVTDTSKANYTPDRVTCKVNGTSIANPALGGAGGKDFTVTVGSGKKVECDVYNKFTGKLNTDVAITKSVSASPVVVGDAVTWTLKATNNGPNTATNVVFTDTIPAGLGAVTNVSAPAGTTFVNGVWTISTLSVGSANAKTLTFKTTVDTVGDHLNKVALTSLSQNDTNSANDNAQANVVGQKSDVTVTKKANVSTQIVNGNVVWTIVAKNQGDATAQNVKVDDVLPAGLAFVSSTATTGSYNSGTGVWTIGTLAKNATATLTLTTKGTTPGQKTNTATISTTTPQTDTTNDSASDSTTFTIADLNVTKTADKHSVVLGDTVVWTITVKNTGTAEAANVVVTDALPPGLTLKSTNPAGALTGNTWNAGNIPAGGSKTLTLTTTVNTLTSVTNQACATTSTPETSTADNCGSDTVKAEAADVTVTKVPDLTQVYINGTVVWTIQVTNSGKADAQNVVVTDTAPAGLTTGAGTPSQGLYNPTTKVWTVGTVAGTVTAPPTGGTATLTLNSTVGNTLGALTNKVDVTTTTPETNTGNNHGEGTTTVTAADIAVTKTADKHDVYLGDTVVWTIKVTNHGTATANDVVIEDAFPAGLQVLSTSPSGVLSGSTWAVGSLAPSASATLVVTTKTTATGTLTNSALGSTSTPETNTSNNEGHDSVNVTVAELAIEKSADVHDPSLGGTVVWTVKVTNSGSADASDVVVADLLPAGLAFQSAAPSQGTYDSSTGAWTVGKVAKNGGTATLTLTTKVNKTGQIKNVACAATETPDRTTTDDCDDDTVDVHAPKLVITKTASKANADLQGSVSWDVKVTNTGDATANDVVVTDVLPAGLTLTSSSATKGSFDDGAWNVGSLTAGSSATLTLVTTVTKTGALMNTACAVTSSNQVGNPGPVCDDDTVNVHAPKLTITKTADEKAVGYNGSVNWTVTVTNTGDADATDVVVNDAAVPGLTVNSGTASQGSFDKSNGVWNVGTLAKNGGTASLTLNSTVTKLGEVKNTACATTAAAQVGDPGPVCDDDTVTVTAPDLSITKVADTDTAVKDGTVSWTITVKNNGNRAAANVVVTDTNPGGGLSIESGDPSKGTFDKATGIWTVGTVGAGATETLTVTTTVERTGDVTNKACVATDSAQVEQAVRCDDDTVKGTAADVTVTKSADQPTVVLGTNVTWTIKATNNGDADAKNVVVLDALPDGATVVSTVPADALDAGTWNVGTLAKNGGSATLTVTTAMGLTGDKTNVVDITTSTPETDTTNNHAEASVKVTAPDLAITKTADLHQQYLGGEVVWTVSVTNNGDADAQDVVVEDVIPDGLELVKTEPANALVNDAWTVGTLAKGATATLKITTRTLWTGDLTNEACVTTSSTQAEQSERQDNARCDEDTTTVTRDAKLEIEKTQDASTPNPRQPGSDVTYDITVSSTGKSPANDVHFTDVLPDGLVFKSAVGGDDWSCTNSGQVVDCTYAAGDLAAGTSAPVVKITVTVDPTKLLQAEPVTNTACITPGELDVPRLRKLVGKAVDEQGTGQCDSAETTFPKGELTVVKTSSPDSGTRAQVGDTITYTLKVTANGELDQTAVGIVDDIPGYGTNDQSSKTTYVAGSADCVEPPAKTAANCAIAEATDSSGAVRAIEWQLGDLAHGQSRTVTFQVTIDEPQDESLEGTVTNVGFAGSDQTPDGVPSNQVDNPFDVTEVLGGKTPNDAAPLPETGGNPGGVLASTGADLIRNAGVALLMVLAGAFVIRMTRRREEGTA